MDATIRTCRSTQSTICENWAPPLVSCVLDESSCQHRQMRGLGGAFPGNQLGPPGPDARPHSPMNGDNAPSPKRPRVEGGGFPNQTMGGNPGGPTHMANGQGHNMPHAGLDPNSLALMNNMQGKRTGWMCSEHVQLTQSLRRLHEPREQRQTNPKPSRWRSC